MKYVERLLVAYLLLKPFYIFESGGLQIADLCLLAAFIAYLFLTKFDKKVKQKLTTAVASNKLFILFIVMTFIVNLAYFIYFGQYKFILSSLYFVFTFIAILMFSIFCQNKNFLIKMSKAFKFSLIAQVAIFALGLGTYYSPDRYMSTFNDPNQFAFFIFISYLFIYAIKILLNSKDSITVYLIMAAGLIYLSASTGMLLGLSVFLFLQFVYSLFHLKVRYATVRNMVYAFTSATIMVIALFLTVPAFTSSSNKFNFSDEIGTVSLAQRLKEKSARAEGDSEYTLWEERGYDKIYKYPGLVLYGAGEGNYERYTQAATVNELHATLPSMLFYYGIIPFLVLLRWIYLKIKGSDPRIYIALAALFAESFTLLNQRQSLFWIFIIIGGVYTYHLSNEKIYDKSSSHEAEIGGHHA